MGKRRKISSKNKQPEISKNIQPEISNKNNQPHNNLYK